MAAAARKLTPAEQAEYEQFHKHQTGNSGGKFFVPSYCIAGLVPVHAEENRCFRVRKSCTFGGFLLGLVFQGLG
jgi:hypothetical protein